MNTPSLSHPVDPHTLHWRLKQIPADYSWERKKVGYSPGTPTPNVLGQLDLLGENDAARMRRRAKDLLHLVQNYCGKNDLYLSTYRNSILDFRYWKAEAEHYEKLLRPDFFDDGLVRMSNFSYESESSRKRITDPNYWKIEAAHYCTRFAAEERDFIDNVTYWTIEGDHYNVLLSTVPHTDQFPQTVRLEKEPAKRKGLQLVDRASSRAASPVQIGSARGATTKWTTSTKITKRRWQRDNRLTGLASFGSCRLGRHNSSRGVNHRYNLRPRGGVAARKEERVGNFTKKMPKPTKMAS